MHTQILNKLKYNIYKNSYELQTSHIESCITALPIIYNIFKKHKHLKTKNKDGIFILSSGHAGLALYVVLEHFYGISAKSLFEKHGVHPNRDLKNNIVCSSGSLGSAITIATGIALGSPNTQVDCLVSDGEIAEGTVYESLRFIHLQKIKNINIHVNYNGWSALDSTDKNYISKTLKCLCDKVLIHRAKKSEFSFLKKLEGHYYTLNDNDYKIIKATYEKRIR